MMYVGMIANDVPIKKKRNKLKYFLFLFSTEAMPTWDVNKGRGKKRKLNKSGNNNRWFSHSFPFVNEIFYGFSLPFFHLLFLCWQINIHSFSHSRLLISFFSSSWSVQSEEKLLFNVSEWGSRKENIFSVGKPIESSIEPVRKKKMSRSVPQ